MRVHLLDVNVFDVNDAHLLALALRRDRRVATFDRGFLELVSPELDPEATVTLIP